MKITFAELPQFEILQINKEGSIVKYSGIIKNISKLSKAEKDWIVTICAHNNKFIKGRFSEITPKTFQAVVTVQGLENQKNVEIGSKYPLLDGYWGDLVILVFDPSIIWKRVKFEPSDSTVHYSDGRVEVVKGGWEHEHCEICSQTISQYESDNNPYGYVSQKDNWLCETCYQKYVQEKSLDFINLEQLF